MWNRYRKNEFDVILLSDFRFSGGTSHSNAEEIRAQAGLGLSTGLLQVPSPVLRRDRPISQVVQKCVDDGLTSFIRPDAPSRCRLLVVRHPTVLLHSRREMPLVDAERLVVIVNQPPLEYKRGATSYDLAKVQANARRFFGTTGTWFPIGPLVRKVVEERGIRNLAPDDWCNIIQTGEWQTTRTAYASDRPVIGRHSRDSVDKWPDNREALTLAYPDDDEFKVRILGGAAPAEQMLGQLPANWEVLPFGAQSPQEFLAGIDFFVYYHHPLWVEAFGRTILEALASGAPAILPPHFAELFEDAAIYAEPAEVRSIVRELYADRARYEERSRRGIEFVEHRFSHAAHARRLDALLSTAPRTARAGKPRREKQGLFGRFARPPRPFGLTALLAPESVHKVKIELGDPSPEARGLVRGMSRTTGKQLFALPVNGSGSTVSTFVVTNARPERVDVTLELDRRGAGNLTLKRLRAERRGERPRPPRLGLTDTSVTAAMATYPGRAEVIPAVIDSLVTQVAKLFVYLNNYEEVPAFIRDHPHRDRIVFILDPASERRAAAKFHWLSSVRGFHLLCDDDIIYPPDYAARLVDAVERRKRRAIVGVHGVVFQQHVDDARGSRRQVFKFPEALAADAAVHFLGTGTVALHVDVLASMDLSEFHSYPVANDEILAVSARRAGVPMVCIAREAQWLKPHAGAKFGIFQERLIDQREHDTATQLLASANPWPELARRP